MEGLGLFVNAENVRTLVMLLAVVGGYMFLKRDMNFSLKDIRHSLRNDMLEFKIDLIKELDDKMEKRFETFHAKLKDNDFKHLNETIEALTFILERNGYLSKEDKRHIDGRLDK